MAFFFNRFGSAHRPPPAPYHTPPHPPTNDPFVRGYHPPANDPFDQRLQSALQAYVSAGNGASSSGSSENSNQVVQKGTLVAVASSIRRCVSGMSPWDISDLTLGLYKIATRHALEGSSDTISGSPVSDKNELQEMLHWLDWAWASYLADKKSILEFLQIEEHQLKKHVDTSAILKPAYCIAVDDNTRCVVLSIRGTYAATDVLTDLQPHSEKFESGYAHSGMLSAAHWILDNETESLRTLMRENPGYKLVLTGHSLGAGAASLLCFLLRESTESENQSLSNRLGILSSMVECWGFGCPPCVDRKLSEEATFIQNVVLQDDIVARASIAALEDLRSEILQTDWAHVLEDGGLAKKMLNLVKGTESTLGNFEQALGYQRGTFYQQAKSLSYAAMVQSFQASMARAQQGRHGPPGGYGFYGAPNYFSPPGHVRMNGPPAPHGMPQNLGGWLSLGASAIGSYLQTQDCGSQVQSATIFPGASDQTTTSREFMECGRLFVPGILYHIKRRPVQGTDSSPSTTKEGDGDTPLVTTQIAKQDSQSKSGLTTASVPVKHFILKGSDPKSRFMKIILSRSMLSDHSLIAYKEGIKDAIHCHTEGKHFPSDESTPC